MIIYFNLFIISWVFKIQQLTQIKGIKVIFNDTHTVIENLKIPSNYFLKRLFSNDT